MSFPRHEGIFRSDGRGSCRSGARSERLHAPTHRLDEFPPGYSSAGWSPPEPASASPAEQKFTMKAAPQPSLFQRMGKPCLAGCFTTGVHPRVRAKRARTGQSRGSRGMSFPRHEGIFRSDGRGSCRSGARSERLHAPTHRLDEFPPGYSSAGWSPPEPASASPAEQKFTMKAAPQPSLFQRVGKPCLAGCFTTGVHPKVIAPDVILVSRS